MKAGLVLGLDVRALEVRKEDEYGLRGDTLRAALDEDLARGKRPFIVSAYMSTFHCLGYAVLSVATVGTVGTTSSGAIDNVGEIGEVRKYCERRC